MKDEIVDLGPVFARGVEKLKEYIKIQIELAKRREEIEKRFYPQWIPL